MAEKHKKNRIMGPGRLNEKVEFGRGERNRKVSSCENQECNGFLPQSHWDQSHGGQQCPSARGAGPHPLPFSGDGGKGWRKVKTRRKRTARRRRRDLWEVSKCLPALESSVTRQWVPGVWVGEAPPCPLPVPLVPCRDSSSASQPPLPREGVY